MHALKAQRSTFDKSNQNKSLEVNRKTGYEENNHSSLFTGSSLPNSLKRSNGKKGDSGINNSVLHSFVDISVVSLPSFMIQPKLKINKPGDRFEKEADRQAENIMRSPKTRIQRKCTSCEEEQDDLIFRDAQNIADGKITSPGLVNQLNNSKANGQPLDRGTKLFMESHFGVDLNGVRVHNDHIARRMNQSLKARAFTHGSDIYFNRDEYNPGSPEGKWLLAHELTHVIQQRNSGTLIQRLSSKRINPNLVEVEHNNEKYRVTRKVTAGRKRGSTSASIEGDIDQTNVSITINVCRNKTRGSVELGANVPERARQIAQKIIQAALKGSSSDIEKTLQGADVTPFVEILLARSGQLSLTARGEVTVGLEGVTAGGGSLKLQAGEFGGSISGSGSEKGWQVTGSITYTPGRKEKEFECTKIPMTISIECQKWHDPSKQNVVMDVPFRDEETRFIYFDYEKATIERERSADMLKEITNLLQQGYRVSKITGHTSPEGPMEPGRRFPGNIQLGRDRARAALEEIEHICKPGPLSMRRSDRCVSNVTLDVETVGKGELFTRVDKEGKEVEGRELARHAVGEFKTAESESLHRDQKLLKRMEKMSLSEQRDEVYPLLRRATVTLVKSGMRKEEHTITLPGGYRKVSCPREVENAARLLFNL